jgi:hypothetical protein
MGLSFSTGNGEGCKCRFSFSFKIAILSFNIIQRKHNQKIKWWRDKDSLGLCTFLIPCVRIHIPCLHCLFQPMYRRSSEKDIQEKGALFALFAAEKRKREKTPKVQKQNEQEERETRKKRRLQNTPARELRRR